MVKTNEISRSLPEPAADEAPTSRTTTFAPSTTSENVSVSWSYFIVNCVTYALVS